MIVIEAYLSDYPPVKRGRRKPMKYYLAKTDPGSYTIEQFEADRQTVWDGVKNPQALVAIRAMKKDDRVFIYQSGTHAAVVGVAKVAADARPDPQDAKLAVVDLVFLSHLNPPATLREIKESGLFGEWALVRQGRLSTMAAPSSFAEWIRKRYPAIEI